MASKTSGNKKRIVLLALLGAIVAFLAYTYYISPASTELAAVEGDIQKLSAEVARARAQQAQLPELMEQVRRSQERLQALRRVLPTEKETAEIVRKVQEMAIQSNLRIKSFTPQDTVQREFYQDWPIMLSVEGNFDSLGTFLERIGRFQRIINVSNLAIKPVESDQRTRERSIAATCTATTFVFQEVSDDS